MEIWKAVRINNIDYTGHYEVSDIGNIRSLNRKDKNGKANLKGRLLKPAKNSQGYIRVKLCINGIRSNLLVHRIVASTFIGPIKEKMVAHHKNGVKNDNRAINLDIITHRKNCSIERTKISGIATGVVKRKTGFGVNIRLTTNKSAYLGLYKTVKIASMIYQNILEGYLKDKFNTLDELDFELNKIRSKLKMKNIKRKINSNQEKCFIIN